MTEKEIREAIADLELIKQAINTPRFRDKVCSVNKAIYALEHLIDEGREDNN